MTHDLPKNRAVILPDDGRGLLREEAAAALSRLGFRVLRPRPEALDDPAHEDYLPRLIGQKPALFFSINLQGLLSGAAGVSGARALLEAGIPVLAWFVDNPWHILSGMRDPSWKALHLAVTDKSFVEPLRLAGAMSALHLPLAASPEHMGPERPGAGMGAGAPAPEKLGAIVFAGRSAFPNLESFFAGQELAPQSLEKALNALQQGQRPDFAWWARELGLAAEQKNFWPGKKARKPGKGAAECNKTWRGLCLAAAQKYPGGLTVFGDAGWQGVGDLRGPVDYYTRLPAIYRAAAFSLNLNSLLLPEGLSQRVFDAWAAGGFCLTDWSPGLEIFPPELVSEITFRSPEELPALAAALEAAPGKKEQLRRAWREHILAEHTYEKRLAAALGRLELL